MAVVFHRGRGVHRTETCGKEPWTVSGALDTFACKDYKVECVKQQQRKPEFKKRRTRRHGRYFFPAYIYALTQHIYVILRDSFLLPMLRPSPRYDVFGRRTSFPLPSTTRTCCVFRRAQNGPCIESMLRSSALSCARFILRVNASFSRIVC